MDLPVYVRRADKSPAPSAPTGGALSGDEYDGNLDETERALTELDAETVKTADAVELDPENPEHVKTAPVDGDLFPMVDSEAVEPGTMKLVTKANLLADVTEAIGDIETILASI